MQRHSQNRNVLISLCSIFILLLGIVGCTSEDPTAVGEPCSREDDTVCDSLCLLDLPGGMCSHDCEDDEGVCPDDYVCGEISGGRYCLLSCEEDDDCRDDMICVVGVCRGLGSFGDECGEEDDCESGICHDGSCSVECSDQGDCTEGVSCVDLGDGTSLCVDLDFGDECDSHDECASGICHDGVCNIECHDPSDCADGLSCIDTGDGVPICLDFDPPSGGEGTYGENCTFNECADGFDCISRTEDAINDPYAFCTRSCLNELDCPADMACRRTQVEGEDDVVVRCVPRQYCERCAYDAQCGSTDDHCVSQDPRQGAGRYCSQICDPDRAETSCPTDSSCLEAFWCQPDRAWVADCEWCSDPELCDSAEDDEVYQCFHDYGACRGNGDDYCSPCFTDDDCPEGGQCMYEPYTANSFCTAPCDEEDGHRTCPDEHYCVQFGLPYLNDFQCMPRQGSCSEPSGGLQTCSYCDIFGDCLSGYCINEDLSNQFSPMVCWEDCSVSPDQCPPYTQCNRLADADGNDIFLCGMRSDFRSCAEVQRCLEECPEGPDSCSDDARFYCL